MVSQTVYTHDGGVHCFDIVPAINGTNEVKETIHAEQLSTLLSVAVDSYYGFNGQNVKDSKQLAKLAMDNIMRKIAKL